MRGKSVALVILLIISMFFSGFTFVDIVGNDNGMDYKVNGATDSIFYFNQDLTLSNTPTEYWVEFTVSEDGKYLSFETNNITLSQISVKGGNKYRLYSGLGATGEDLRAPLNNGGNVPTISHYSFNLGTIIQPWLGNIEVTKSVDDWMDDTPDLAGFTIELWQDGVLVESKITDSNGKVVFSNLSEGSYLIKENLGEESDEWDVTIQNNGVVVLDQNDDKTTYTVTVHNEKIWKGTIRVQKELVGVPVIDGPSENEVNLVVISPLAGFNMELWQDEVKLFGPTPTNNDGIVEFGNLTAGDYTIKEILGEWSEFFSVSIENNGNITIGPENDTNDIFDITVTNTWKTEDDPWTGTIRVIKDIVGIPENEIDLEGFEFEIWQDDVKIAGPLMTDEFGEVEFPDLAPGTYEVKEILGEASMLWTVTYENEGMVIVTQENESDDVFEIDVTNTWKTEDDPWTGTIRIIKDVVGEPEDPPLNEMSLLEVESDLEGFAFEIWKDDVKIAGPLSTDEFGVVEFPNLAPGTYEVKEILGEAASLWTVTYENEGIVIVTEENETYDVFEIDVTNTWKTEDDPWTGTIRVQKAVSDSQNSNPSLSGFQMELWEDGVRIRGPLATNSEGIVEFNGLSEGQYQVREVLSSLYQTSITNNGNIEISEENETDDIFLVTVTNTRVYTIINNPPPIFFFPPPVINEVEEEVEIIEEEVIPETPPVVEEEEVIEEEIMEVEEEIEIEEDPIPQATLPRTGSSPSLLLYGLMSLVAGLTLKGKKDKR